jgi:hypothetical protein
MQQGLAATLANLDAGTPERNVSAIKDAVVRYLREADSAIEIDRTDYFNHSFSPDLVLSWSDSSRGSRRVFIRTDSREASLREDLDWVVADAPLNLPLTDVTGGSISAAHPEESVLDQESSRRGAMISTPRALEELHGDSSDRVCRLFSQAVVRGGKGLLNENRARHASTVVAQGYVGAQRTDAPATAAAVSSIEELVTLNQAKNVTRLLQAVWIGSGAPRRRFQEPRVYLATLPLKACSSCWTSKMLGTTTSGLRSPNELTFSAWRSSVSSQVPNGSSIW